MIRRPITIALLLGVWIFSAPVHADEISGKPCIVDGDTLAFEAKRRNAQCVGGTVVNLWGIAAFHLNQACRHPNGRDVRCGLYSASQLQERIKKSDVLCEIKGTRPDGSTTAECFVDKVSLNKYMITNGVALAYRPDTERFVAYEAQAKNAKKGLWITRFTEPWKLKAK